MSARKLVCWVAFAVVPVVALWIYGLIAALDGYERTCGPLSGGYRCTKWKYIEEHLFNAFVAPGLIAASATWLLIVAVAAVSFVLFRKVRKVSSRTIGTNDAGGRTGGRT